MYEVLDVTTMVREIKRPTSSRTKPLSGYNSVILCKPGTATYWIPANSMLRRTTEGYWEVHTKLSNREILKRLAIALDAIAFM